MLRQPTRTHIPFSPSASKEKEGLFLLCIDRENKRSRYPLEE